MADSVSILSLAIAAGSLIVAVFAARYSFTSARAARDQAVAAEGANAFARQIGQSEAVIHFTGRFFDLMKDGRRFGNPEWEYQFWSLHSSEFYFFDSSWIPGFMYLLWMVELAENYRDVAIRRSHVNYLRHYSGNYPQMCDFFNEIQEIANRNPDDDSSRARKVGDLVEGWHRQQLTPRVG